MFRLNSSLRTRPTSETLALATAMAAPLGITRVTDTTWLDRVGIPVFASIRPRAAAGSLCVSAGKGLKPEEAKVGATMEAIELAIAERNRLPGSESVRLTPAEMLRKNGHTFDFVDLCPRYGAVVDPHAPILCAQGEDLHTGGAQFIPAELVFLPATGDLGQRIFGSTSSGLASGNDPLEATVHALFELLERDVQSFTYVSDRSHLVDLDDAPATVLALTAKARAAGLALFLRFSKNAFGLPFFQAFLLEEDPEAPISVAVGTGCHAVREVAAVRAITEAAQSRLSHIHGGRDDIIHRVRYFEARAPAVERLGIRQLRERVARSDPRVSYQDVPDLGARVGSLREALDVALEALARIGARHVVRCVLTPCDSPLAVVKVVVPRLEAYDASLRRVGPRLVDHVRACS